MNTKRLSRDDGNKTKEKLIRAAGQLIAKKGFALTTSKDICQRAGANVAAVNYHFGSRDKLYDAVLEEVVDYLFSASGLEKGPEGKTIEEKFSYVISHLGKELGDPDNWQAQVWIREAMNPSDHFDKILKEKVPARGQMALRLLSEYTGRKEDDEELAVCFFCVMAPMALFAMTRQRRIRTFLDVINPDIDGDLFLHTIQKFLMAGVNSFRVPEKI